ncbi:GDYXXLXY domain-containing protein [Phenylobacterium sp.]|jgi:hypothetical protein|uniref:GDYXXLXY domain-containing protein n=1 Tax=Phenylobacterium sp. TaxID=1871053 RepID=UPI002F959770
MTTGPAARILATAVILSLSLVGLVVHEGVERSRGVEVVLPIAAYDPRSPLSGHYVAFSVEEVRPAGSACPPGLSRLGESPRLGWVALRREGAAHRLAGWAPERAVARKFGEVVLRGAATCIPLDDGVRLPLDLGVDRFHVDQRQAQAIEAALRSAPVLRGPAEPAAVNAVAVRGFAVLSAGRDGKARLKALIVDGRRTDLAWL